MTIKIKRDSGYADRLRAYKVVLNGEVIGKITNGQTVEFDIPKGIHKLQLKIDWCRSNIVEFEMKNKTIEFECGSNLRGAKIFLALFYILFLSNKYIWLKKIDS